MSDAAPSVLIVDDDDTFRSVLVRELTAAGLNVNTRSRGEEVEEALLEVTYDVVVLDLRMAGMDGIATLDHIKAVRPLTEVIILTGQGSLESAVQALKLGAHDFLTKPCGLDHLESVIRRAARARAMRSENAALRQALNRRGNDDVLLGHSPAMERVRALIEKVAPTGSTVLIQGETGTGKEVIARAIHQLSDRRERPFVVLDCGATEESLALSELFGHEQGAYTGATGRKHGLFELADFGTILVDEVGDAPMSLQTRLLRVLETGTFRRLGSEGSIRVNVRILAATHRDLESRVRDGTFRQDLYYRLNVLSIAAPPLRERIEDLRLLVEHFLARLCPGCPPDVDPSPREGSSARRTCRAASPANVPRGRWGQATLPHRSRRWSSVISRPSSIATTATELRWRQHSASVNARSTANSTFSAAKTDARTDTPGPDTQPSRNPLSTNTIREAAGRALTILSGSGRHDLSASMAQRDLGQRVDRPVGCGMSHAIQPELEPSNKG
jgi:DNA-binding NtrC family response regulator